MLDISVVIPAYNEEKRIGNTLRQIETYLKKKGYSFEILIIDDGSTDRTKEIVKKISNKTIMLENKKNYGKGYSVKKGILHAKGTLVLLTDSDLSTPISELPKLKEEIDQGYDLAIGSRRLKGSKISHKQPFYRELAGRSFNLLIRIMLFKGIKDTQCGFKLLKKNASKKIFKRCRINGFSYDVELLLIAKRLGYKIVEVPVIWNDRPKYSKINVFRDSMRMFYDLVRIRRLH